MNKAKVNLLLAVAVIVFVSLACSRFSKNNSQVTVNTNSLITTSNTQTKPTTTKNTDTAGESTSGAERQKPAAGKGNVQGKVLFNDAPVEGIEVKLCENFSTIMGIKCDGKTATTNTGADGVYVLPDLEPKTYGGLTAKVFKSNYFVYPQSGIMTPQTFTVTPDTTIFSRDIKLFKNDIKITSPKAGSKVEAQGLELKWEAYPDAAYYKVSLYPDQGGLPPVNGERVEDPAYSVTESLTNGKYRMRVESYNANDSKLAETGNDYKFSVSGGAEPTPKP